MYCSGLIPQTPIGSNSWSWSLRQNDKHIKQILKLVEYIVDTGAMLRSFSQPALLAKGSQ
jgi:hypothetical protein